MTDKRVATLNNTAASVIPSADEWGTIYQMAKALLPTGFLPTSIKTPEQATAIMLKGRELQVPPLYALSNIVVVQGKPTCSAELMLALVQRDHGMSAMWIEESTNDYCKIGYRAGGGVKYYSFTMEDAKRANLLKNSVWNSYPAAMLRARAISAVSRMAFPGSIAGLYVAGELGDEVEVDDDGVIVSASINAPESPVRRSTDTRSTDTRVTISPQDDPFPASDEGDPDVLDNLPLDLKDAIAQWWKYDTFEAMPKTRRTQLRIFVSGQGAADKQAVFDKFVQDWEAEQQDEEAIEGEIVQDSLIPDEDALPTPASFRN